MRDRLHELGDATEVVLITFTDPANIDDYTQRNPVPFPILRDPDRVAYLAFGLERASLARVYSWQVLKRYLQIFRANGMGDLRRATDDTRQLGGDFIVDPDGTLVYGYWSAGPEDRPSVDDLIAALAAIEQ